MSGCRKPVEGARSPLTLYFSKLVLLRGSRFTSDCLHITKLDISRGCLSAFVRDLDTRCQRKITRSRMRQPRKVARPPTIVHMSMMREIVVDALDGTRSISGMAATDEDGGVNESGHLQVRETVFQRYSSERFEGEGCYKMTQRGARKSVLVYAAQLRSCIQESMQL
jgi:hypothetical protein